MNQSAPNLGPSTAPITAAPPLNLNGVGPNTTGGGLFGNTQQNNPAPPASGLFGNTGATNASGGLFGNANKIPATGTNLFGNTAVPAGGSLFGNAGNTTGGGLFGNTNNTQPKPGGLFGNTGAANTTTGGSLFGNTGTASTGGRLFGNTGGSSLFGNAGGTNLFGNTGSSLFGNVPAGTTTGSLFGNNNNNNNNNFMFNGGGGMGMGGGGFGRPNDTPLSQIIRINSLYEPGPRCLFQHVFYSTYSLNNNNNNNSNNNNNNGQSVSNLSPPTSIPEQTWKQAIEQNNPDRNNLIPTPLYGFKQLKERAEQQTKNIPKINELVQKLLNTIEKIKLEAIKNKELLNECRNRQWELSKRLIQLLIRLEIIKNDRHPLYTEEINYNNRLRELLENLSKPNSFNARLTELNSLKNVQGWKFTKDNIQFNDKQRENLESILAQLQDGVEKLTDSLKQDLRVLNNIKEKTKK